MKRSIWFVCVSAAFAMLSYGAGYMQGTSAQPSTQYCPPRPAHDGSLAQPASVGDLRAIEYTLFPDIEYPIYIVPVPNNTREEIGM